MPCVIHVNKRFVSDVYECGKVTFTDEYPDALKLGRGGAIRIARLLHHIWPAQEIVVTLDYGSESEQTLWDSAMKSPPSPPSP